jgi:AraC-like DNA-binding protein
MNVQCPNCGHLIAVKGLGRKPLNIPLKNIIELLQVHYSIGKVAELLGCSEGYIYGILKRNGLRLKDLVDKYNGEEGL